MAVDKTSYRWTRAEVIVAHSEFYSALPSYSSALTHPIVLTERAASHPPDAQSHRRILTRPKSFVMGKSAALAYILSLASQLLSASLHARSASPSSDVDMPDWDQVCPPKSEITSLEPYAALSYYWGVSQGI